MPQNTLKSVVLVGGGHAHALVLNALKTTSLSGARVTVINPEKTAPYSGMLPGFVAGHYERAALDIDLAVLAQQVGAQLVEAKAVGMDPLRKVVILEGGAEIGYDLASLDVGITSRMDTLCGFSKYGIPAKPLGPFSQKWDAFRRSGGDKTVAIIGGGIAGAELAMAMAYALRTRREYVAVKLLDRGEILSANSPKTQMRVRKELFSNNVDVLEDVNVVAVTPEGILLANGIEIAANFVVGAAGGTPHDWLAECGLATRDGFVEVDRTLETSAAGVFAVGDCAHMIHNPRPKAGVYAVRQAPVLLRNLRNSLAGQALKIYAPQSDYLKLVSLGGKRAFGEKMGVAITGHWVWRLKDDIDRKFMTQF